MMMFWLLWFAVNVVVCLGLLLMGWYGCCLGVCYEYSQGLAFVG